MPAPNQNWNSKMWQDPVFGYFEAHGKSKFVPGEQYDLTRPEMKAVVERNRIKQLLKMEYLRREFHPIKRQFAEGTLVDPAMFRWYAMDMTGMEYFRMTPKAVFFGLICTFGPAYVIWRLIVNTRNRFDEGCRKGEYLWWDRRNRLGWVCGSGAYGHYGFY